MLGDSVRRRQPQRMQRRLRMKARPVRWHVVIPAIIAALVVPFAVGYAIAVHVMFPPPVATGTGIVVPNLVGKSITDAQGLLAAAGLGELMTVELPHPDAPAGQILAQDPLGGQQLRAGESVTASVSSGRPRVTVPDVEGLSADAAEQILKRMGFETRRVEEPAAATPGRVIRLDPMPGSERALPATITLVVSAGPAPLDTLSVPFDTMAAIFPDSKRAGSLFRF